MLARLGLITAGFLAVLFVDVALAASKPPPDNPFRKGEAVAAIATRCAADNHTACVVPFKDLKNKGTRGSSRIYCGIGKPVSGSHKNERQRYRVVVTKGEVPYARRRHGSCRR
jgi:hypothetical protein